MQKTSRTARAGHYQPVGIHTIVERYGEKLTRSSAWRINAALTLDVRYTDGSFPDWHFQSCSRTIHHSKMFALSKATFSTLFHVFAITEWSIHAFIDGQEPAVKFEVRFSPESEYGRDPLQSLQVQFLHFISVENQELFAIRTHGHEVEADQKLDMVFRLIIHADRALTVAAALAAKHRMMHFQTPIVRIFWL
jgi:hypothetical protein